jgi:hypothetical protein
MSTDLQPSQQDLYTTDFVRWVETTVKQLRAQDYTNVDWANLIEEIEDMSRRERRSLESHLIVVFLHLLKWQFQPDYRGGSWRGSIREHRRRILRDLKDSPSLKPYFHEIFSDCYRSAREQAADETGRSLTTFPTESPYSPEQVLDSDFLPD